MTIMMMIGMMMMRKQTSFQADLTFDAGGFLFDPRLTSIVIVIIGCDDENDDDDETMEVGDQISHTHSF